jgi:hypothetical protein
MMLGGIGKRGGANAGEIAACGELGGVQGAWY